MQLNQAHRAKKPSEQVRAISLVVVVVVNVVLFPFVLAFCCCCSLLAVSNSKILTVYLLNRNCLLLSEKLHFQHFELLY